MIDGSATRVCIASSTIPARMSRPRPVLVAGVHVHFGGSRGGRLAARPHARAKATRSHLDQLLHAALPLTLTPMVSCALR